MSDLAQTVGCNINIRYVDNPGSLTPAEQAQVVHSADVVLTPQGAHIANLWAARECTVLIAAHPKNWYESVMTSLV